MDEIQITDSLKKYTDGAYALADLSTGWDCINMLIDFYGNKIPRRFGDWTPENYAERWRKDQPSARKILREFLLSLGASIPRNYALPGDLMLFEKELELPVFPGIYQGSAHVMVNWGLRHGVRSLPLRFLEPILIDTRRLG